MRNDLKNDFPLLPTRSDTPEKAPDKTDVVVLMSGGVDSSAAALLLRRAGLRVAGLTMRILENGDGAIESAAEVCRALEIPHFWVDLRKNFRADVINPFCKAYLRGETPNPCANCNERVKLGLLAQIVAANWGKACGIATGHYARITGSEDGPRLCRARDVKKDQSYFLAGVPDAVIRRISFPLGEMGSKEETREIVRGAGLPVAERPDSMEICFTSDGDYQATIDRPGLPGPILDKTGRQIGEHCGIAHYTLGQRKGLGVAAKEPLYVVDILPAQNTVVAATREEAFTPFVRAKKLNILIPDKIQAGKQLYGKIRSQGEPLPCRILETCGDRIDVAFETPVFAPAPGQRLVLYTEEGCVALGGEIVRREEM